MENWESISIENKVENLRWVVKEMLDRETKYTDEIKNLKKEIKDLKSKLSAEKKLNQFYG